MRTGSRARPVAWPALDLVRARPYCFWRILAPDSLGRAPNSRRRRLSFKPNLLGVASTPGSKRTDNHDGAPTSRCGRFGSTDVDDPRLRAVSARGGSVRRRATAPVDHCKQAM